MLYAHSTCTDDQIYTYYKKEIKRIWYMAKWGRGRGRETGIKGKR